MDLGNDVDIPDEKTRDAPGRRRLSALSGDGAGDGDIDVVGEMLPVMVAVVVEARPPV